MDRYMAAQRSIFHLARDGALIIDNSDWRIVPAGRDWRNSNTLMDLLREENFRRVDFYGRVATSIRSDCTSICFRNDCFLFQGREDP
jgi:hypothetical protein